MSGSYRVALPTEYPAITEFISLNRDLPDNFKGIDHPVVLYEDEHGMRVALARHFNDNLIVVGPLAIKEVDGKVPRRAVLKVVDLYEKLLISAGVTHYFFAADARETRWISSIERLFGRNSTMVGEHGDYITYRRDF